MKLLDYKELGFPFSDFCSLHAHWWWGGWGRRDWLSFDRATGFTSTSNLRLYLLFVKSKTTSGLFLPIRLSYLSVWTRVFALLSKVDFLPVVQPVLFSLFLFLTQENSPVIVLKGQELDLNIFGKVDNVTLRETKQRGFEARSMHLRSSRNHNQFAIISRSHIWCGLAILLLARVP